MNIYNRKCMPAQTVHGLHMNSYLGDVLAVYLLLWFEVSQVGGILHQDKHMYMRGQQMYTQWYVRPYPVVTLLVGRRFEQSMKYNVLAMRVGIRR